MEHNAQATMFGQWDGMKSFDYMLHAHNIYIYSKMPNQPTQTYGTYINVHVLF